MRIIAGSNGGIRLHSPKSSLIRPTSDRARENLFNILANRIDFTSTTVLDLFAGTGAFGFECLSRGAKSVHFIDSSKESIQTIEKNMMLFPDHHDKIKITRLDVMKWIKLVQSLNETLVFADPPYFWDQTDSLIGFILNKAKTDQFLFIFETHSKSKIMVPLITLEERIYGTTKFNFITKKDSE